MIAIVATGLFTVPSSPFRHVGNCSVMAVLVYVRTSERMRKLRKRCHTLVCFSLSFLAVLFLSFSRISSFFSHRTSSSCLSFLQLNTNNYDLPLRIIQTFCLHLSRSSPLRKTRKSLPPHRIFSTHHNLMHPSPTPIPPPQGHHQAQAVVDPTPVNAPRHPPLAALLLPPKSTVSPGRPSPRRLSWDFVALGGLLEAV